MTLQPRSKMPGKRPVLPGSPRAQRKPLTVALLATPCHEFLAEAQARGWRLLPMEYCGYAISPGREIDGALLGTSPSDPRIREMIARVRTAVRLSLASSSGRRRFPAILPDPAAEGRLAAGHFAERGFRHVAYVGSWPLQEGRRLFESFRDRATELGMTCHRLRISRGGHGRSTDSRIISKQRDFTDGLRTVPKPVGLLAPNDQRAARYAFWADEAGFNVPLEVAILGRGNRTEICDNVMPTLSSIDRNDADRIRAACELLARLMAGERPPRKPIIVPPAGIVERESTRLLAMPDPDVAAALRYLWDHLDQDLSVDDVACAVGVSRRKLERVFHRDLRHGVNDELRRKRLKELCRLMLTTDRSVARLAPTVGFRSLTNLYKAFHAAYGMTPRQYRRMNGQPRSPS